MNKLTAQQPQLHDLMQPLWEREPELKPDGLKYWPGSALEWSLDSILITDSIAAALCTTRMQEWSGLVREDRPYFGLSLCQQHGGNSWNAMIGHTGLSRAASTIVEASANACAYILNELKPRRCPSCGRAYAVLDDKA